MVPQSESDRSYQVDLRQAVGGVISREDLADFVRHLRTDLAEDPGAWENDTLDRFLGALAAWTDDMDGYFLNFDGPVPTEPTWEVVAMMLAAARTYE